MTCSFSRGLVAAAALLFLSIASCPKPASTQQGGQGTQTDNGGSEPAAKGYVVRFERPIKVGQKYSVTINGESDNETLLNGKALPGQSGKLTYSYQGVHTVKAVDPKGKSTKEELKILKLQVTKGGATKDVLAADTLVLAYAVGSKEKFSIQGKPVAPKVAKLLEEMVDLADDDPSTDEVFGAQGPKKPGDSWSVNKAKLLAGLKDKLGQPALWPKAGDTTGTVTLVAAKKVKGMDALEIQIETKINNIAPAMGPVKATAGTMEITMSGLIPQDSKLAATGMRTMSMTMRVEGEMQKGGQIFKLVVNVRQRQTRTDKLIE